MLKVKEIFLEFDPEGDFELELNKELENLQKKGYSIVNVRVNNLWDEGKNQVHDVGYILYNIPERKSYKFVNGKEAREKEAREKESLISKKHNL